MHVVSVENLQGVSGGLRWGGGSWAAEDPTKEPPILRPHAKLWLGSHHATLSPVSLSVGLSFLGDTLGVPLWLRAFCQD